MLRQFYDVERAVLPHSEGSLRPAIHARFGSYARVYTQIRFCGLLPPSWTQFSAKTDWIFASPVKLGRQPWSYDQVLRSFLRAAETAGIGRLGTHPVRHTYRSWLDAARTPVAVQQKLIRHGDIRTTMNVYGDVVTDEMQQAHSKVVRMAMSLHN